MAPGELKTFLMAFGAPMALSNSRSRASGTESRTFQIERSTCESMFPRFVTGRAKR
jgi:hypothetical protein